MAADQIIHRMSLSSRFNQVHEPQDLIIHVIILFGNFICLLTAVPVYDPDFPCILDLPYEHGPILALDLAGL